MRKTFFREKSRVISLSFAVVLSGVLSCFFLGVADEEEEDASGSLRITSQTELYSADIYIREEESGPVPEKEKEADKKRTDVGMGEIVFLELTGKPYLIGDVSKISWAIAEGENLASFEGGGTGKTKVKLVVSDAIAAGGNIRIEATVESKQKVSCSLSAVVPKEINGMHQRKSYERTSPDFNVRGVPSDRTKDLDGKRDPAGASALLEINLSPTNVNFSNAFIIERAKDTEADKKQWPLLAGVHNPRTSPSCPDVKNCVRPDTVSSKTILRADLKQKYILPQSWTWKCDLMSCDSAGKDLRLLLSAEQRFSYKWISALDVEVSISKFGCRVRKATAMGNVHIFDREN